MIEDWPPQRRRETPDALVTIATDFFTPDEVGAVERLLTENPLPHATLHKERVEWPIPDTRCPYDFGGYGPSSLSFQLTEKVEGYAYSVYDFETVDGKRFDPLTGHLTLSESLSRL
jgi:hypothetical protein